MTGLGSVVSARVTRGSVGAVVGALILTTTLILPATGLAAAQSDDLEPAVIVNPEADGDGNLTIRLTHDLTTETEQAAFEAIRQEETTREKLLSRFEERMSTLANSTSLAVDREVRVDSTDIEVFQSADGDVGVVRLTATIDNLAAVNDGQLKLSEPLSSGFESDRDVIVTVPESMTVEKVTPEPTDRTDTRLHWEAGTVFEDFEFVVSGAESTDGDRTATETPGFGIGIAALSIIGGSMIALKRRS